MILCLIAPKDWVCHINVIHNKYVNLCYVLLTRAGSSISGEARLAATRVASLRIGARGVVVTVMVVTIAFVDICRRSNAGFHETNPLILIYEK